MTRTLALVFLCAVSLACANDCWSGEFTEDLCCDAIHGQHGLSECWDGIFTYDRCCLHGVSEFRSALRRHIADFARGSSQVRTVQGLIWEAPSLDAHICRAVGARYHAIIRMHEAYLLSLELCLPQQCSDKDAAWAVGQLYGGVMPALARSSEVSVTLHPMLLQLSELYPDLLQHAAALTLTLAALSIAVILLRPACSGWSDLFEACGSRGLMAKSSGSTFLDALRVFLTLAAVGGHVGTFALFEGSFCAGDKQATILSSHPTAQPLPVWHCSGDALYRWVNPGFAMLSAFLIGSSPWGYHGSDCVGAGKAVTCTIGRLARAYVRQVPQHLAVLAAAGSLVLALEENAGPRENLAVTSMMREARESWLQGAFVFPLWAPQANGLRVMTVFSCIWQLQLGLLIPLIVLREWVRPPWVWGICMGMTMATMCQTRWLCSDGHPRVALCGLREVHELAPVAILGFACGSVSSRYKRIRLFMPAPITASLGSVSAALMLGAPILHRRSSVASLEHTSISGTVALQRTPVALFGMGLGGALVLFAGNSSSATHVRSRSCHVLAVLSRLSLGMMVNNFPIICAANSLMLQRTPLSADVLTFCLWVALIWVVSLVSSAAQWCILVAPAQCLLKCCVEALL